MSVVRVIQWTVDASDREACERALRDVAVHVESAHPAVRGFRTCCHSFGPLRPWTYFASFEFESVMACDCDHDTPGCEAAWGPVHELAQAGSFAMSFWSESHRDSTQHTWACAGFSEEFGAPVAPAGALRR